MLFTDGGEERAQEIFNKYNQDKKVRFTLEKKCFTAQILLGSTINVLFYGQIKFQKVTDSKNKAKSRNGFKNLFLKCPTTYALPYKKGFQCAVIKEQILDCSLLYVSFEKIWHVKLYYAFQLMEQIPAVYSKVMFISGITVSVLYTL